MKYFFIPDCFDLKNYGYVRRKLFFNTTTYLHLHLRNSRVTRRCRHLEPLETRETWRANMTRHQYSISTFFHWKNTETFIYLYEVNSNFIMKKSTALFKKIIFKDKY